MFATVTASNFAVAGESLCDQFGSKVAAMSLSPDVNGLYDCNVSNKWIPYILMTQFIRGY